MARAFEWDANAYEDASNVQHSWGVALLESRTWKGDERVLDAGCGTGALAEETLKRAPRGTVVAVDNDPRMVEKASARLAKHAPRARTLTADLLALPALDPFDLIFSNAVLHWIPDHDKLFREWFAHLKPGGELLAQGGGEGNLEQVRATTEALRREPDYAPHFRGWTPPWHYEDDASTQERLFITGFVDPEVSLVPTAVAFPDDASLAQFANAVILRPYLGALPSPQLRTRLVKDFVERMRESGLGRTLDYRRLTVRAFRPPHA